MKKLLRKLRLLARACRNVFSSARTNEAEVIDAEARLAEAQGLAYGTKLEAKTTYANAKHENRIAFLERLEVFFSNLLQQFGELRKKFSDWRIERINAKVKAKMKVQKAEAEKPKEIKVANIQSVILTLLFIVLLVVSIIFNIVWLKAIAPVGIIWSAFGLRVVFKTGFYARLGQVLIFIPTMLWLVIWLTFRTRS